MAQPGIFYVVAYRERESGIYIPVNEVYAEVDDAIEEACSYLDDDPNAEPRVVQLIIDPMHQGMALERATKDVLDEIALEQDPDLQELDDPAEALRAEGRVAGLERALELIEEQKAILTLEDVEEKR
ncbi:MAG TPA: hypothetical protein VEI97_03710 [bacterium]|nr:hypothetical protein [bacterium]